ncbi:GCN5-related N-acetyltransferase 7, chloroplastic isoform X1 [Typha latifolia]|uniref:GCN5-related N-acetyltransferase 7, chloroplastic isoform X1 n=1 Tax=Typha latifolia TaxID=4733 RepID=UPI003C2B4247
MALLSSSAVTSSARFSSDHLLLRANFSTPRTPLISSTPRRLRCAHLLSSPGRGGVGRASSHLCEREALALDVSSFAVREFWSEEELWAAVRLRFRTFYEFRESCGVEDHRNALAEREFEALKDRISGKRIGFKRVSCINATLPLSPYLGLADDLSSACKFSEDGQDKLVVGTLDLNQCLSLADELTGKRPEVNGGNIMRAYLSNVCVAKEIQRNGLGFSLVAKSKEIACEWGITDLYVHVAVDNKAAQKLYQKSGFIYEDEEPAWRARFLGRPRRFLLWADLKK